MKLGIVGLPNVGKSTLFNAITKAGAESANYPFCTIEPNIGVVPVPDYRLEKLSAMFNPKKVIPAIIEFVDIAGLVKGASHGEGLGNKFLSHIREVDAIVHVVRCFDDENVIHVDNSVDPLRDIETINLELIFADLEMLERRLDRVRKMIKTGEKIYKDQLELYEYIKQNLENSVPVRLIEFTKDQTPLLKDLFLLTSKPVIYAANVSENDVSDSTNNEYIEQLRSFAANEESEVVVISARIEEEISQLLDDEKSEFLNELGIPSSGLDKLITSSYRLLGLISFLTAGPDEVRGWTIKKGIHAPQAAGKIHSDFERGFIRAEVIAFDELMQCGSYVVAREKGLIRSEGKDYVMRDGDVTVFRFNV